MEKKQKIRNWLVLMGMSIMIAAAGILSGCGDVTMVGNKQTFDMTYSYERAILSLPNGDVIEGEVTSWTDFADGDQIQVKIDGKQYLVHSANIVLISE